MGQNQRTLLRNGKIIDTSSETTPPEDLNMAQANSNDSDTNDNSDISSQLSERKESYERRISELHQEFSQLNDLMMAIVNKNSSETQSSSSQGPSKRSQQQGFDTVTGVTETRSTRPPSSFTNFRPYQEYETDEEGDSTPISNEKKAVARYRNNSPTDKEHQYQHQVTVDTRPELQRTKGQIRGI